MQQNATDGKGQEDDVKEEDPDVKDMFSAKNSGMVKNKAKDDVPMTKKQRKLAK